MVNRRLTLLLVIIGIVVVAFLIVAFVLTSVGDGSSECVDVSAVAGFVYDICYDSYTQNIFILVKGQSDYYLDTFRVSFDDGVNRSYDLGYSVDDVSQLYKFYAEKNPLTINLDLNVFGVSDSACDSSRDLVVRYCDTRKPGGGDGSLNGSEVEDYIPLPLPYREDYPEGANYTEKEFAWVEVCESDWDCLEWEACDGQFQRRSCVDLAGCAIPIGSPDSVRYCGDECFEDWDCEWGDCVRGFMEPVCVDLNGCGTGYDKPNGVSCDTRVVCQPDIFCGAWSECEVNYGLLDLVGKELDGFAGTRSRVCADRNNCVESREEVVECSVGVDIYVQRFSKCDENYIGIYNSLNDNLIARIKEGEISMDIYFDDRGNNSYCDYCYDGILNEDEEGIDCGGSCVSCDDKYKVRAFRKEGFFERLGNWLGGLF